MACLCLCNCIINLILHIHILYNGTTASLLTFRLSFGGLNQYKCLKNIKELCTQQPGNGRLKLFLFQRIVFYTNFDLKKLKVRQLPNDYD